MSGVQQALEDWVRSLPGGEHAGIIGDWIAVVCMVDVGEQGQPVANYYLAMRDGSLLPHTASGLLDRGLEEVARNEEGGD